MDNPKNYNSLPEKVQKKLESSNYDEYGPFDSVDYIDNPIALARIKAVPSVF
jgi:hypothetical protein